MFSKHESFGDYLFGRYYRIAILMFLIGFFLGGLIIGIIAGEAIGWDRMLWLYVGILGGVLFGSLGAWRGIQAYAMYLQVTEES